MKKKSLHIGLHRKHDTNVFLILVITIFISETLIMLLLRYLPAFSTWGEAILDSSVLSILIFPVIYYFLVKPLKESIADRNEKESRYLALIETMGEGVVICDENEQFVFVNSAAEKIFAAKKETLIGSRLNSFFSIENFAFIQQQTIERKKGISSSYETEIILKDHTKKTVFITASPQFENGIFTGTLALFHDISELKKAEDAIKYERNLLRALINNLPDAVYVKDKAFKKIIANPVDLMYMGLDKEEDILGKDDYAVYPKEIADSSFTDDQHVLSTGMPYLNKEDYFVDNNGQEHWMLNSKVPIKDANGTIIGLVGIGREITARKKEETHLKLLESVITNATDGVVITQINDTDSLHYRIIFVNNAYCKMTGYTSEEVIGKSPSLLQGENTSKEELTRIRESLKRFESCRMEVINYKKDGTEFWTNIAFFPISDNTGKYTHWIAIKRDVTARKVLEQNYIKAKEKAESASKAKSEFLANMSHEIRTPLNSVIGFSDLLMKTQLDSTQQQYNHAVFQSANSLLDIISEILDFSKIEAGKLEIDIVKTDVLDLSYQVADIITFQAFKKNLELLLNIGADIPRFIWTDPIRLRQILINLMGNAVKFTSSGEVQLKIEILHKTSANQAGIRFSVKDTGIGINPENQQKIFEAFSQEDASTNRKYGGTGLGLTISKQLLTLMGSELKLASIPGQGSTFFFDLEVKTMDGDPEEWNLVPTYKKVLIVDDNTNNRLLLKEMLALQGVGSDEAESGKTAIEMLQSGSRYDIILMDYNMPEMDGIATIRHLREDLGLTAEKQPIVLLHSSAEDEIISKACKTWDIAFRLVKPIKMGLLFKSLSKVNLHDNTDSRRNSSKPLSELVSKTGPFKVLLVDDNEFNILLIRKIVGELLPGAAIYEASNGKKALDSFVENKPDIIFMDVHMPEMNGYEATMAIRKLETDHHIPIIALTAGTQSEEKDLCTDAGMNDFVTKPFVSASIVDVLNKWL
ncbi:MAG: hypothetical protein RLZZ28_1053 [Bacteroidota bacterium]